MSTQPHPHLGNCGFQRRQHRLKCFACRHGVACIDVSAQLPHQRQREILLPLQERLTEEEAVQVNTGSR